jgi:hypothetical protein
VIDLFFRLVDNRNNVQDASITVSGILLVCCEILQKTKGLFVPKVHKYTSVTLKSRYGLKIVVKITSPNGHRSFGGLKNVTKKDIVKYIVR